MVLSNFRFKNLLFIFLLLIITGFLFYKLNLSSDLVDSKTPNVKINNNIINLIIADSAQEQYQGLSDRESLNSDQGMLFIFSDKQPRTFVMRRMHFPLDIIWIDDNKIIGISKNLPPEGEDYKEKYDSIYPANYVLEVNAGFCDEHGIKIGDEINYNL